MTTRDKIRWSSELEENQWMAVWNLYALDPEDEGELPADSAMVYVREEPPGGKVRIWHGDGTPAYGRADDYNEYAGKPFNKEQPLDPFLFATVARGGHPYEAGKLDDDAKKMLEERFKIDLTDTF